MSPAQAKLLLAAMRPRPLPGIAPEGAIVVKGIGRKNARTLVREGLFEVVDLLLPRLGAPRWATSGYRITEDGRRLARAIASVSGDPLGTETNAEAWARWPGATKCAACGCSPPWPCLVFMPEPEAGSPVGDDVGRGLCVPAGIWGSKACSRCASGAPLRGVGVPR